VADYGALAADNWGTEQCGAGEALAAALPAAPASAEWGITLGQLVLLCLSYIYSLLLNLFQMNSAFLY